MAENENRKKYIAVDPSTQETNQLVRLGNPNNQISGRIKAVDGVNPIELDDENYTLEDIAQKLNEILLALKRGGVTAFIACMACMGGRNAMATHEGQAKLGTLSAKTYVVTQEVDSVFTDWLNHGGGGGSAVIGSNYNLQIGVGTTADLLKSVAMGVFTSTTNYNLSTPNSSYVNGGYSIDFCGPTLAFRHSTAVGAGAQAISQVAIAIGERAMVHGLHGPSTSSYGISVKHLQVKELSRNGLIVSVVTNELSPFVRYIDRAMYEYPPSENLNTYELLNTSQGTMSDGSILTTREYARTIGGGQIDPRYATQEEMNMYDIIFNPGQPDVNFKDAIYGVAVGYRAMCAGYHTLALGHYARAYRPHSVAVGPSSHIKSEGAIGLGYSNTVDYNSPFSLAIGSRISIPQGFTNAIVIGMPKVDFSKRFKPNYHQSASPQVYTSQPRAMKSNSINIVVNGEGLKDFFLDDVSIHDRLSSEVEVIGNGNSSTAVSASQTRRDINNLVGLPSESNEHIVMFSKSGGLKIFTKRYIDILDLYGIGSQQEMDARGVLEDIEINGRPLQEMISRNVRKKIAMFIIPVNVTSSGSYVGFELKASTNNFSRGTQYDKTQFYSQSEIADSGQQAEDDGFAVDRMKMFVGTSHGSSDVRAYTRITNTLDWPNKLYNVVVIVDASCLVRHPSKNGEWLNDMNENLIWCYARTRNNDPPYEQEYGTTSSLWRPIAPVKWFDEMPEWAMDQQTTATN